MANAVLTIVLLVVLIGSQSAGNVACMSLINHEKRCKPTLKKNVTNRLLSSMWQVALVTKIFFMPGIYWRILVSPLQSTIGTITYLGNLVCHYYIILTLCEIVVMRCLYIASWTRMAPTSDSFFAIFLKTFNYIWIGGILCMLLLSGEYLTNPMDKYLSGNKQPAFLQFHHNLNFYLIDLIIFICLLIISFGGVYIVHQKRKNSAILSAVPTPSPSLQVVQPEPDEPVGFFEAIEMDNMERGQEPKPRNMKEETMIDEVTIAIFGFGVIFILESLALPVLYLETEEWYQDICATIFVLSHFVAFTILPCYYNHIRNKGRKKSTH